MGIAMSAENNCYVAADAFMRYALCDALAVLNIPLVAQDSAEFALDCYLEAGWLHAVINFNNGKAFSLSEQIRSNTELRRTVVKTAVKLLLKYTDAVIDRWGILRGVRPTKLAASLWKKYGLVGAAKSLAEDCLLDSQTSELVLEVAQNEANYLQQINLTADAACLYIGVPFCPTRCSYCSFPSFPIPNDSIVQTYLNAVKSELQAVSDIVRQTGKIIVSLYVGGGTPVSLTPKYFSELLLSIREYFPTVVEFTVECGRPELINLEVLAAVNRAAVSRLCINPQSLNDSSLRRIGRAHSEADVYSAFELTRQNFGGSINMDVIAGLSGEICSDFENTLNKISALQPENITVHSLALKRGAAMFANGSLTERKQVEQMLSYAYGICKQSGYVPYYLYRQKNSIGENVGYCLNDCQCLYNIMIIEEQHTIFGVGPAAATKMAFDKCLKSVYNPKDYQVYIDNINKYIDKKYQLFEEK
ncbi:MAG: coproporphyrinogen dehydrogenase HemZ [Negativicutes bacterium]|jgi:oxygen-independent coproporphyrinogen-3 oxidase